MKNFNRPESLKLGGCDNPFSFGPVRKLTRACAGTLSNLRSNSKYSYEMSVLKGEFNKEGNREEIKISGTER